MNFWFTLTGPGKLKIFLTHSVGPAITFSDGVVSTVSVCTTFGVDSTKIAFPGVPCVAGVAGVFDGCAARLLPP